MNEQEASILRRKLESSESENERLQREIKEDRGMLFNLLNLILYYGILVITLLTVCWLVILGIGLFQILSYVEQNF